MGAGHSSEIDYEADLLSDTTSQTVTIGSDAECKGETAPRRCLLSKDKLVDYPQDDDGNDVTTVWQAFQVGAQKDPSGGCFGARPFEANGKRGAYKWISYEQTTVEAKALGIALRMLGLETAANVGLYAKNCIEWCVASLGNYSQTMRSVALYDTLGGEAVLHIIKEAGIELIYLSKDKVAGVVELKKENPDIHLKYLVQFDTDERFGNVEDAVDADDVKAAAEAGIELLSYQELLKRGQANPDKLEPVEPETDDLAFIMYTSGTTGLPKGAKLSHSNLVGAAAGSASVVSLTKDDRHISYLPLAHIFETVIQTVVLINGGKIGFYQGDVKKLTEDFMALQPTIVCGVPRIYGKIYDKIMSQVKLANCIKSWVFNTALAASSTAIRKGERVEKWDKKVWNPLAARIGLGNVRVMVTGAAPIPAYLFEFLKVAFSCVVLQGYGLTETSAGSCITRETDHKLGHVGPPLSCCEVKLVDIPEMNYLSTDKNPRGEVWVRGANVFKGYYENPEKTNEVLKEGGWLATGDVGRFNPNGTLSIIDRKKNIFKMSQGEYIAVEKIEGLYQKAGSVNQIWIYGNSFKPFVVAVVVPDAPWVVARAQKEGLWTSDSTKPGEPGFLAAFKAFGEKHSKAARGWVLADMKTEESAMKGFEKARGIFLEFELDDMLQGFGVDNNCLTPSFKLKRPGLLARYVEDIKALYAECGDPAKADENWGNK